MNTRRVGYAPGRWLVALALLGYGLWIVAPMLWVALGSVRPGAELFSDPFGMPDPANLRWDNYGRAWGEAHFGRYLWNSAVLTLGSAAIITFAGAMAAYAFTRLNHRLSGPLFWLFLAGLVIPAQLAVVPLFFQMRALDLLGTTGGLMLVYVAGGLPFAIFVLAPFFRSLPKALHEAAVLDGCTEWQVFLRIMLPLARPGLATVAIFQTIGIWKEYLYAFMLLSGRGGQELQTVSLALGNLSVAAQYRSDPGMLFAGVLIVSLPVLAVFLLLQRRIAAGLAAGAVKG